MRPSGMAPSPRAGSLSLVCSGVRSRLLNPEAIGAKLQECAAAMAQRVLSLQPAATS